MGSHSAEGFISFLGYITAYYSELEKSRAYSRYCEYEVVDIGWFSE